MNLPSSGFICSVRHVRAPLCLETHSRWAPPDLALVRPVTTVNRGLGMGFVRTTVFEETWRWSLNFLTKVCCVKLSCSECTSYLFLTHVKSKTSSILFTRLPVVFCLKMDQEPPDLLESLSHFVALIQLQVAHRHSVLNLSLTLLNDQINMHLGFSEVMPGYSFTGNWL